MAWMVRSMSTSSSQPSLSAPWRITSRLHPAANFLSLNFFFRLLTSMSWTLRLGRILAAAPMRPVSSSAAKRTFSISWTGSTSAHRPKPWLTTAWTSASSAPAARSSSGAF